MIERNAGKTKICKICKQYKTIHRQTDHVIVRTTNRNLHKKKSSAISTAYNKYTLRSHNISKISFKRASQDRKMVEMEDEMPLFQNVWSSRTST